jgi:hypothetical protein
MQFVDQVNQHHKDMRWLIGERRAERNLVLDRMIVC